MQFLQKNDDGTFTDLKDDDKRPLYYIVYKTEGGNSEFVGAIENNASYNTLVFDDEFLTEEVQSSFIHSSNDVLLLHHDFEAMVKHIYVGDEEYPIVYKLILTKDYSQYLSEEDILECESESSLCVRDEED